MATYVKELAQILKSQGQAGFRAAVPHPVLVIMGLARQLQQGGGGERTVVATKTSEDMEVSSLVGRMFPLCKEVAGRAGPITVGRTAETDVKIPEYSISKHHCEFRFVGGSMFVRDAGSTNGTEVNQVRLANGMEVQLQGGETVVLGRFAFRFDTPASLLQRLSK